MKLSLRTKSTLFFLLGLSNSAFAELSLPMSNYPLQNGVETKGYQVMQGVVVDINEPDMALGVTPTNDLYYIPSFATTELTNKSTSIGANCSAVEAELSSETILANSKRNLLRIIENNQELINQLLVKSAASNGQCINQTANLSALGEKAQTLRERYIDTANTLKSKRTELGTCQLITPDGCEDLAKEVIELATKVQQASSEFVDAQNEENEARVSKTRICAEATAASSQAFQLIDLADKTRKSISSIEDDVIGRIDSFGTQYGGTAIAVVSSRSKRQQEELESANPLMRVRPVEINSAKFQLSPPIYGTGKDLIPRQTVLAVSVVGGDMHSTMTGSTFTQVANASGSVGMTISLSRLGACSNELTSTAGFQIEYNSYSYLNGIAKWNKWNTYKKIESTTKKGGFFSSKTVHDLWEEMKGGDSFKFVLLNDNSGIDSDKMRRDLQAGLLDRILKAWAEVKSLNTGGTLSMPSHGQNGAQAAADGLSKCPHMYCQAGVLTLKTMDAIWGRQVSEQNVQQAWDVIVEDRFSYTQVYPHTGMIATEVVIR